MSVKIADKWFETKRLGAGITHLWEPYVHPLLRCNIWHVSGSDRDMLVDTGLGISSLKEAARDLFDKPLDVVATHAHYDHVGGHFEFENCIIHEAEADKLVNPPSYASLDGETVRRSLTEAGEFGYTIDGDMITRLPHAGYDLSLYRVSPAKPSRLVVEGDRIDLGNRHFEILHLPGHSPGGIGLWEPSTGTLFSGDTIYDGPLLDKLTGSNIDDYITSMRRLREMPVTVVHAGHDPSFGKDRLVELCDVYLASKGA